MSVAWQRGESAGAHLAATRRVGQRAGASEGALGNPDQSSAVNAVCGWFGPSDFLRMNDSPGCRATVRIPRSQKLIGAPQSRHGLIWLHARTPLPMSEKEPHRSC